MAITSAICNSFKEEILQGGHCLNASGSTPAGNAIKCALYSSNSATLSKSTTVYTAPADGTADPTNTYEVTSTGSGYTTGGSALTTSISPARPLLITLNKGATISISPAIPKINCFIKLTIP